MAIYEVPLTNDLLELLTNHGRATELSGSRPNGISEVTSRRLSVSLMTLTADQSLILYLRFWEHMSFREIQREMGHKSVSMTHRVYNKALGKVKAALNENDS